MKNFAIETQNLSKTYGVKPVLSGINLTLEEGEVVAVLGPSGSGKSTLIRILNGLESFQGSLKIQGVAVKGPQDFEPIRNEIGMVFQNFNLFPHLTLLENITLAPKCVRGWSSKQCNLAAQELLDRMNLTPQMNQFPSQLSGGQAQRAAIARALVLQPKILLFDEPTSALDPEMTEEILRAIKDLSNLGMTMILVTHEMGFARDVANRVLFFDEGKILEDSESKVFFENPSQERIRIFLNTAKSGISLNSSKKA